MMHAVVSSSFVITNNGVIVSLSPGPKNHLDVWVDLVLSPGSTVRIFQTFDFGPRISGLKDFSTAAVLFVNGSSQRIFHWCSSGLFSFAASGLSATRCFSNPGYLHLDFHLLQRCIPQRFGPLCVALRSPFINSIRKCFHIVRCLSHYTPVLEGQNSPACSSCSKPPHLLWQS